MKAIFSSNSNWRNICHLLIFLVL